MKTTTILSILLILIPFLCQAQNVKYTVRKNHQTEDFRTPLTQDSIINSPFENAGLHMRRFSVLQYTGISLNLTGAIFASIGLSLDNKYDKNDERYNSVKKRKTAFVVTGLGLFIGGTICNLFSINHIFQSGRMLELAGDDEGLKLKYKF